MPRERQTRLCACFFISSELSYHRCAFDAIEATGSRNLARQPGCSSWKVRDPFRQSSVAHAPTPIPDVSTMVEKIDFMKSGATNEARQYAETITLEMCKHTAKACGFITTGDTDPVNVSDSDAVVRRRKKQTDLNQFFFTLGVASLSGLRRRFYSEKLPEPFPGLTPLLHDRVSAILVLPRAEFVSVRHDHDHVRFSSRRRGSRRQFSPSRATGQPWSRRSTSRRAARRTRRGSTPRPSPWRCASTPPRRAASSRRTRSPAKTTPSGWTSAPPYKRSSSPSACHL